jgi:Big-like domain-containing protein
MFRVSQSRISRKLLALFVPIALVLGTIGATAVSAAPRLALINGATVSGSPSHEQLAAEAAGFTVTVVSDATWATMTAAQFGEYELLIAGDPFCGRLPPGLVASAPVWGSVVLGMGGGRTQAGNRIIVGTDPVLHDRLKIVDEGIAFAGLQPGRTGMYLDVTCAANYFAQSAETLTVVNAISSPTASGAWTIDALPPCGGSVALIATVPGSFPTLTTADLQGWSCSVHEAFPTFKGDFSALAIATDTVLKPTCGVDKTSGQPACGAAYILIAGPGIVVVSGSISLAPLDDTNPVGTNHTVTATVKDSTGAPLANQAVTFEVTGVNAGAVGTCSPPTCTTDASGNVSFTYNGAGGPGDDTIKASFTDASGSLQSATAQKHWTGVVLGPPANLDLQPASDTNPVGTEHCVTATVTDSAGAPTPGITVNFSVSGPNGPRAGSGVTDASGQARFCYTGNLVGMDTITATAVGGSNPSDTATKTWTTGQPATLVLTPKTDTNTVGDQHCVTATVRDQFGNPNAGVTVRFSVAGSVTTSGSATTNASGQAQFCYTGPALPGADTITAYADTDNDNVNDPAPADPEDTATKTWVIPANQAGCKVTNGGWIITTAGNRANFGGNAKGAGPSGNENYEDHGLGMHVKSTQILAVTCSRDGTSASIFGKATVAGSPGTWDFRIDVRDLGEPGRTDRYRIRLSNGYDSGDQQLSGGNIQMH